MMYINIRIRVARKRMVVTVTDGTTTLTIDFYN